MLEVIIKQIVYLKKRHFFYYYETLVAFLPRLHGQYGLCCLLRN